MTPLEKERARWHEILWIVLNSGPRWVSLPPHSTLDYKFSDGVVHIGCDANALCRKYKTGRGPCSCECPIKARTGKDRCEGSPWDDVYEALLADLFETDAGDNLARKLMGDVIYAVEEMTDFLDGLEDPEK